MLSKTEKIKTCEEFIRNTFGIEAFRTLYLFEENITSLFSLIDLYGIIIVGKKNLIPNSFSDREFLPIRQFLALDIILKLQVIIESTLVLSHSLSSGYHSIARNMTYYDFNLLKTIRENIVKKQYDSRRILGLPEIDRLPISREEKKFLAGEYQKIEEGLWDDPFSK